MAKKNKSAPAGAPTQPVKLPAIGEASHYAELSCEILSRLAVLADVASVADEPLSLAAQKAIRDDCRRKGFDQYLVPAFTEAVANLGKIDDALKYFRNEGDRLLIKPIDPYSDSWHALTSHLLKNVQEMLETVRKGETLGQHVEEVEFLSAYFTALQKEFHVSSEWCDVLYFIRTHWRWRTVDLGLVFEGIVREGIHAKSVLAMKPVDEAVLPSAPRPYTPGSEPYTPGSEVVYVRDSVPLRSFVQELRGLVMRLEMAASDEPEMVDGDFVVSVRDHVRELSESPVRFDEFSDEEIRRLELSEGVRKTKRILRQMLESNESLSVTLDEYTPALCKCLNSLPPVDAPEKMMAADPFTVQVDVNTGESAGDVALELEQVKATLETPMGKAADETPAAETASNGKQQVEEKADATAGYLNIMLDDDHLTITRVGSDISPIELSKLQWSLCKLFVASAASGVNREQLDGLPGERSARTQAISTLRELLTPLALTITDGRGGKSRVLTDDANVSKNSR